MGVVGYKCLGYTEPGLCKCGLLFLILVSCVILFIIEYTLVILTHPLAYGFGFVGGGVGRVPGWVVHVCWFGCRLALARGCCCCHCFLVLVCGRGGAWACMGVRGAFAFCSGAVPFVSCLPVSPPGRLFLVPWVCGWGFAPPRLIFWIVNIP